MLQALQTRLKYANFKVLAGWKSDSLEAISQYLLGATPSVASSRDTPDRVSHDRVSPDSLCGSPMTADESAMKAAELMLTLRFATVFPSGAKTSSSSNSLKISQPNPRFMASARPSQANRQQAKSQTLQTGVDRPPVTPNQAPSQVGRSMVDPNTYWRKLNAMMRHAPYPMRLPGHGKVEPRKSR